MNFADSLDVASLSAGHPVVSATVDVVNKDNGVHDWYQESLDAKTDADKY
jgi:hypothetical protein